MKSSEKHGFYKPEINDDIIRTIEYLFTNFGMLDNFIDEKTDNLSSFLQVNTVYEVSKKIWKSNPAVGSNLGWINLRTGKFAPTWQANTSYSVGDQVLPLVNNGHIYTCVEDGTSVLSEPSHSVINGTSYFDIRGASEWISNYVYNIDDIVLATDGSQLFYFKCIRGGTSAITEPVWVNTSGATIMDGSTQWQTFKTVKWKESGISSNFREFGNIV